MLAFGMSDELFEQPEGGRVQPLEIVEKQHQRVFFSSERAEESSQHRFESVLGFLRREFRYRWLLTDHQLQFGDQVEHQLAIGTERFEDSIPPMNNLLLAFT